VKDGEFPRLDRAWAGGVRVAFRLASRVWATAGVQFLSRGDSASLRREYQTSSVDPNASALVSSDTTGFVLGPERVSVRSYGPSVGLRLTVLRARPIAVDAVLLAGMAWANCRLEENNASTTTWYRKMYTSSMRMDGHGVAPTGEVGLRAGWNVSRRWGAFVEGTYLRQRFAKITGTGDWRWTQQDGDATSVERESSSGSVSGRWRMVPYSVTTAFVTFNRPYPTINDYAGYAPFTLDLSGVRLRAGIALRLW
jgi:hypothetical protein